MTLELKLPPPAQAALVGLAMWALAAWVPFGQFRFAGQAWLAVALAVSALPIMALAIRAFIRADTTVDPRDPSQAAQLVSSGVFAYSRNPMYCGLALLLSGLLAWLGNACNIALLVAFVWTITNWQIKPEERALEEKFGDAYRAYCARVRRWL